MWRNGEAVNARGGKSWGIEENDENWGRNRNRNREGVKGDCQKPREEICGGGKKCMQGLDGQVVTLVQTNAENATTANTPALTIFSSCRPAFAAPASSSGRPRYGTHLSLNRSSVLALLRDSKTASTAVTSRAILSARTRVSMCIDVVESSVRNNILDATAAPGRRARDMC